MQKKSPLLATTPPQITRALAYSHPFLLQLNTVGGLVTWTSDDPWASFLLLSLFWAVVLYGDEVIKWAGPVLVAVVLVVGIYARRFSPLLSSRLGREKLKSGKKKDGDEDERQHHKSLDEIVETLHVFTSRCNMLVGPFLGLTEYLSMPQTPTDSSVRPRLAAIKFLGRLLLVSPIWAILALPPWRIITSRRVILASGTLFLTWHSRPAQVSRAILWRSKTVRHVCAVLTGLDLEELGDNTRTDSERAQSVDMTAANPTTARSSIASQGKTRSQPTGIRFTFTLWENQRRWLGLGWTNSLFTYERAPWTDEHLNAVPPKDEFRLPAVEDGASVWRWVEGSEWRVEGAAPGEDGGGRGGDNGKSATPDRKGKGEGGWIYYDGKVCSCPHKPVFATTPPYTPSQG